MFWLAFYFLSPGEAGYSFVNLPFSASRALWGPAELLGYPGPAKMAFSGASFVAGVKMGEVKYNGFKGLNFSLSYLNSGGIEEYTVVGEPTGRTLYAQLLGFRASKPLQKGLEPEVELLTQFLGDEKSAALALGVGWAGKAGPLDIGVKLAHLGFELVAIGGRRSNLPTSLEASAGWVFPGRAFQGWAFLASQRDYPLYGGFGVCWQVYSYPLELVASYSSKGRELSAGAGGDPINGLSAGFRLKLGDKALVYSWTPFGELGDAHRVELRLGWPAQ